MAEAAYPLEIIAAHPAANISFSPNWGKIGPEGIRQKPSSSFSSLPSTSSSSRTALDEISRLDSFIHKVVRGGVGKGERTQLDAAR